MKPLRNKITLVFTFICAVTYGQSFAPNSCDSTLLTPLEYKKCKVDSVWNRDINIYINYIVNLKTDLLPKYRTIRKELVLPSELQSSLRVLKFTYDTVLYRKLSTFQSEMDKNQKYVQPKAYIASLLSLQTFCFYPDIYAILLNPIHLSLSPKTTPSKLKNYTTLVDKVFKTIPPDLYQQLEAITTSFATDNDLLKKEGFSPSFKGVLNQADITKYSIINFLLWTV
jgi:hypothetical protein